jgi:hypothetical protein
MEIVIEPADNGWLVSTNNKKTNRVFVNREEMIKHIGESIPDAGSDPSEERDLPF